MNGDMRRGVVYLEPSVTALAPSVSRVRSTRALKRNHGSTPVTSLYKRTARQVENDCAVIAIAYAFRILYDDAKALLVEHGMDAKTFEGSKCWEQVCVTLGARPVFASCPRTVRDFVAEKRKGTFMLLYYLHPNDRKSYHIVAARDGRIHGDYSPDCVLDCVVELQTGSARTVSDPMRTPQPASGRSRKNPGSTPVAFVASDDPSSEWGVWQGRANRRGEARPV